MKIAITSQGAGENYHVDPRFGRAKYIAVYDTETDEYIFKSNKQNLNAAQGAGIQAAQNIIETGAEILITGHCGPKAFRVLNTGKVKVFTGAFDIIKHAIEDYRHGKLEEADSADVEGHWQ
jgi:predicted Fe-Mo cluster-binding NifX family protein